MSSIPLLLGPFGSSNWGVVRSGIRWLREEGQLCKPGDVLGYCYVGLVMRRPGAEAPFVDEALDLHAAFLAPASGRLRREDVSHGGFLDRHQFYQAWHADTLVGRLEFRPGERTSAVPVDAQLQLLMLAGRRVTPTANTRNGLLSGWYDRARAWRVEEPGSRSTILSLGICEQSGIFLGESDAFVELSALLGPSAHIVWTSDGLAVPSVRFLLEQLRRTPEEMHAIEADVAEHFAKQAQVPSGNDWMFVGGLLAAMARSPLLEEHAILTRSAIVRAQPPRTVVLSLFGELAHTFRHRRLGYTLALHGFRMRDVGPATRAWLQTDFDLVFHSVDEIHRDYLELIDAIRALHPAEFVIVNIFSSSRNERFYSYAPFDAPLGRTLGSVRAKELNLMLYDLERERGVKVLDTDALVATLGAGSHLPDGVHQSGEVQAVLREQLVRYVS